MQNIDASEGMSTLTSQTELIQLLQDVKSKNLSIDLAETLVKEWEMRYNNKKTGSFKRKKVHIKCLKVI